MNIGFRPQMMNVGGLFCLKIYEETFRSAASFSFLMTSKVPKGSENLIDDCGFYVGKDN